MIRVIFFDVGETLIRPYPSVGHIYSKIARHHGLRIPPRQLNERFRRIWKKTDRMEISRKDGWQRLVEKVFEPYVAPLPKGLFSDLYREFEKSHAWKINPGIIPMLKTLGKKRLRLAVASNWDQRLPSLLRKLGLSHYFERFFISYRLGVPKSHPAFFRKALKAMKIKPSEALHVGDNKQEDQEPATRAGIKILLVKGKSANLSKKFTS